MSSHTGNTRAECLPFIPKGIASLLDVGCSDGIFAAHLQTERPELTIDGVEIDTTSASAARGRMRTVFLGHFPDSVPLDVSYDCITFLDSLEHMLDPSLALREAARRLTAGGSVVASIPNIRNAGALRTILAERDWPSHDHGIFDRTHVRFFTAKSIRRLFAEAGYEIERFEPINVSRHPAVNILSALFGRDIRALQFAVVARYRGQAETAHLAG